MTLRRSEGRLDALFAAADANKDGKLTKDELGSFFWKRFAKPDAQSVTKDELKSFAKERITALRAERSGRRHKSHSGAAKPETKTKAAQPKPEPKSEPKAEAKPAAAVGTAAASTLPASKPASPTQPSASKPVQANAPLNKPAGVSKADAGPSPATAAKVTGPKIGTSATSGGVKAALFAARR
jgi:EF hand